MVVETYAKTFDDNRKNTAQKFEAFFYGEPNEAATTSPNDEELLASVLKNPALVEMLKTALANA